jgi:hypothetical protein
VSAALLSWTLRFIAHRLSRHTRVSLSGIHTYGYGFPLKSTRERRVETINNQLNKATQPPVGAVLGLLVLLFVVIPGNLLINFATSGQMIYPDSFVSSAFTALQILVAWIAGFYQLRGLQWVKSQIGYRADENSTAQPINLNDPLAYKNWYIFYTQMRRWSFSWGIFILVYAIVWLALLLGGLFVVDWSAGFEWLAGSSAAVAVILAAWPAIAAGGSGGVTNMLRELYISVSYRQDFDRQNLMWYLVQPVVGAVLGAVIYMLVASGYFSIQRLFTQETSRVIDAPAIIMIQLALGWVVGFRQTVINQLILRLVSDIVDFAGVAVQLLNPRVWFNKEERNKILVALGSKQDVFKAAQNEPASTRSVWAE